MYTRIYFEGPNVYLPSTHPKRKPRHLQVLLTPEDVSHAEDNVHYLIPLSLLQELFPYV